MPRPRTSMTTAIPRATAKAAIAAVIGASIPARVRAARLYAARTMKVTLPDGTQLEVADGASGLDVAAAIGPRLAAATAAVKVDGKLQDLRLPVPDGATFAVVPVGDEEGLAVLRHSTAHVLAEAARHVFPGVKITIGPPIDNGFYYDFQFAEPITEADLETIEAEMRRILNSDARVHARPR